ncbi:MAG: hypothetical protein COB49_01980 [Alphaproteobacteria bacterium]|nr:MAG: hypothetical protein COB49_01980 [Alphaproteobacteria bacterium]
MSNYSQAQLAAAKLVVVALVRIDFPVYTLRAWTGTGDLVTLGQTFSGLGEFGTVGAIEESMDGSSPRVKLALSGIDPVLRDQVDDFVAQGSPVFIYYGLMDNDAGVLTADPDLVFTGYVDQPKIIFGAAMTIELACMGALEWAKRLTPAKRNSAYHQAAHPGDTFYDFVDDNSLNFPWGDKDAANPRNRGGGSGSGGGGGSGNGDLRPGFGRF